MGSDWPMLLTVAGMSVAVLLASALVRQYQTHKAWQRTRVRELGVAIQFVETTLDNLKGVPLSEGLRKLLRDDVCQRFIAIKATYGAFPDIDRRIESASFRRDNEGPSAETSVGPITDHKQRQNYLTELCHLIDYLSHRGPMVQASDAVLRQCIAELQDRRAEVNGRYFIVQATRAMDSGDGMAAVRHLTSLMSALRGQGPPSEFVKALRGEVNEMLRQFAEGRRAEASAPVEQVAEA